MDDDPVNESEPERKVTKKKTKKKRAKKKTTKKLAKKTSKKTAKKTTSRAKKKTSSHTTKKTSSTAVESDKESHSIQVVDNIIDNTSELEANEKFNIICFGDSITEGAEFPEELRWPSMLQEMLDEYEPGKFKVHNKGVGNDTTANALDRFKKDVIPLLPGIVLIQFGLNDANVFDWAKYSRVSIYEFKKNLREFYRAIFKKHGTCIYIVNHAIGDVRGKQGNRKSYYDNFIPYNDTIRYVAVKLGAPYIDLYEIIRERQINLDYFVSFDKMHLTLEGNMKYAAWVYESLTGEEYIFKEYD